LVIHREIKDEIMVSRASLIAKAFGKSGALANVANASVTAENRKLTSRAMAAGATGMTVVTAFSELSSLSTMKTGDQVLVTNTDKLYVYDGVGWYIIATITNATPGSITGVNATYGLASDGTATVITAVATDPEGFPLTWSVAVSTGSLGSTATVTQADNVFTITPSAVEANAGTFSLTFNVTDGVNASVSYVSAFTLQFLSWAGATTQATIYPAGASGINGHGSSGGISGDGKYVIVGAYLDTNGGTQAGAAYAFERTGTSWNIASGWQRILSPSPVTNGRFGGDRSDSNNKSCSSIAVSGDGLTAVIGEQGNNKAHIYTRSGSTWSFQATIAHTSGTGNVFGYNVGISGDGNTVIVGDSYGSSQNGDMYIFGRSGSTWSLELKQTKTSHFGCSVDLSADGLIAVVGNMYMSGYTGTGGVHIYTKSGSTWTEGATLTSTSPAETNKLGRNVRISGDGQVIIAGTRSPTSGSNSGSALLWTKSGATYSLTQTFLPETGGDKFGEDVSISNDGSIIAIGAPDYDTINSNAGRLYVYQLSGGTYALKKAIDPPGSSPGSNKFGKHAMSQDGTTILGFTIFDPYSNGKGYVFVPG